MHRQATVRLLPSGLSLRAGRQQQGRAIAQCQHRTAEWALCWVQEGRGRFRDRLGRDWPLQPGSCFQRPPEAAHEVHLSAPSSWFFLSLPPDWGLSLTALGLPGHDDGPVEVGQRPDLIRRWQRCIADLDAAADDSLAVHAARLLSLAIDCLGQASAARCDPWFERVCREMDRDPTGREPLAAIAHRLGMPLRSLRARFTRLAGQAPAAWRIRRRLERAQGLLATTDMTIAAIATQLCYPDPATFSHQFRRHCGRSPLDYRRHLDWT